MADRNHRNRLKHIVELYKAGQKSEARRLIAEVIKANPNDADAWYIAGQILDESPKKIKAFERALAVNPSHQAARAALDKLRGAPDLLDTLLSDSDGLFDDDIAVPSRASIQARPASRSGKVDLSNPRIVAGIIAGTLLMGVFFGALCLGTISSGRFLGVVFAPTLTPSKIPTATPTVTPSHTPTPTQDILATATALASTQQYFDSTSTALAILNAQALAATQTAQQFLQTATTVIIDNHQVETAIAATQIATRLFVPTHTPIPGDVITQPLIPIESTYTKLAFSPIDIEYSSVLDRLIFISADPNQLHIFNPNTAEDTVVELSRAPRSVSVGPDGLFAAVGHDAKISYIDLQNAAVLTMLDISSDVSELALAGNGWIYAVPHKTYDEHVRAINIASNVEVLGDPIYSDSEILLHPDQNRIYVATSLRVIAAGLMRYDFVDNDNVPKQAVSSDYKGGYSVCGDIWFSADGLHIFTACGTVIRSSEIKADDMIYNGTLVGLSRLAYVVHVPSIARIMGVSATDHTLAVWDDETYTLDTAFQLPDMLVNGQSVPVIGDALFVNPLATHYYAIVQAGENSGVFGLLVADLPP